MKNIKLLLSASLVFFTTIWNTTLASPLDVSAPRLAVPPNISTTSNRPMLMLATSKDHSLFGPIYNDYEDLEGDGIINTTFQPTFKYYGYFVITNLIIK